MAGGRSILFKSIHYKLRNNILSNVKNESFVFSRIQIIIILPSPANMQCVSVDAGCKCMWTVEMCPMCAIPTLYAGADVLQRTPCSPWYCIPLLALLFGIAFHVQLVLLSYHPIFLRPYHFLKLVSFLGANRTKSASACLWLLRGSI